MKNIYLLWSTIRPSMFYSTCLEWLNKASCIDNIYIKVAVDNESQKNEIDNYNINNCEVFVVKSEKIGVCFPSYYLSSNLEGNDEDIVILSSDDFFPPENWDAYLNEQFNDFNGCLFVRDGYQNPNLKEGCFSITIPIMSFSCLKRLNKAIYHPSYSHMFGDTELYLNVKQLGLLKDNRDIDETTFEHRHHVVGKRASDDNDYAYLKSWDLDHKNFDNRIMLDVNERIKIDEVYFQ